MLSITRKRFELICPDSLESIVLEITRDSETEDVLNIRVSIVLSNGVITLHDVDVKNMRDKLGHVQDVLHTWSDPDNWLYDTSEDKYQHSTLVKISTDDQRSISTLSAMRVGYNKNKITFSDCTKMCSIVLSDVTYPHYDFVKNTYAFVRSLRTQIANVITHLPK